MNHILIAYFSSTKTTKHYASQIQQFIGGDLFEIEPTIPYSNQDLDWRNPNSRSSLEMKQLDYRPPILDKHLDVKQYDVVFLGFPIWWYIAPTIINTFLEKYDLSHKTIITFATSGSSGTGHTIENLKKSSPHCHWVDGKVLNHMSSEEIKQWLASLPVNS